MQRIRGLFKVYLTETCHALLFNHDVYCLLVNLPSKFLHKNLALLGLDLQGFQVQILSKVILIQRWDISGGVRRF